MIDSIEIKKRMLDLEYTQAYIADKMKLSQSALNLKINNSRDFTIKEMFELSDILKIDSGQLKKYFFK